MPLLPTGLLKSSSRIAVLTGAGVSDWLIRNGAQFGLCQIYANEPWHYELRPLATAGGCPPTYSDPTQDPRMTR